MCPNFWLVLYILLKINDSPGSFLGDRGNLSVTFAAYYSNQVGMVNGNRLSKALSWLIYVSTEQPMPFIDIYIDWHIPVSGPWRSLSYRQRSLCWSNVSLLRSSCLTLREREKERQLDGQTLTGDGLLLYAQGGHTHTTGSINNASLSSVLCPLPLLKGVRKLPSWNSSIKFVHMLWQHFGPFLFVMEFG